MRSGFSLPASPNHTHSPHLASMVPIVGCLGVWEPLSRPLSGRVDSRGLSGQVPSAMTQVRHSPASTHLGLKKVCGLCLSGGKTQTTPFF